MQEEFLHYIWKYKLYQQESLMTDLGESLQVLNAGIHNHDSGPDFFNAKIKINNTLWVGNVEIHKKSSDWYLHKHYKDKAYDNVVLQVVLESDKKVYRTSGELIPTYEMKFDDSLLKNYQLLLKSNAWVPCQKSLQTINPLKLRAWLDKLTIERLECKAMNIRQLLEQTQNSWEVALYYQLARNFGFKLNADVFELLARLTPLSHLAKHKDNLFQIEAILFGQAGFLSEPEGDSYYKQLRKEYDYLSYKFKLKPVEKHLWKFLRSRPGNFPTIRIAQFAQLIYKSKSLFSKIIETEKLKSFYNLFVLAPSEYWKNHYVFNKLSPEKSKLLGKLSIDTILINTVIPFLFIYGESKGQQKLKERALDLLEQIKPERNSIITNWENLNILADNAFDSQALIQLKNNYCAKKKCLNCQIGNLLINTKQ